MTTPPPLPFTWDAERSVMIPRSPQYANRLFVDGEAYRLVVHEERSTDSHRHYFAAINEAWTNLPDEQAERFPTPDMLRKYALIETGYYTEHEFAASSKAEALRLAAFIRQIDEYAKIVIRDNIVIRRAAKSQSYRSMAKEDFQKSKTAVLDFISALVGVTPKALSDNAGRAA